MLDFAKTIWGMLNGKPLIRKNRVIKIMACVIILFTLFCSYWDVLKLLGIPLPPRFPYPVTSFLKARLYWYFAIWFLSDSVISEFFRRLVCHKVEDERRLSDIMFKWNFFVSIVDFAFSCYVLLYSIMCLLEYEEGVPLDNPIVIHAAWIYLLYCFLGKSYREYKILWDKWHRKYTGFVDDNGEEIYVGARVIYNRKKYTVEKSVGEKESHYELSSFPYRWSEAVDDIPLEEAVNDEAAHIVLEK